jgi:hypothetical protein
VEQQGRNISWSTFEKSFLHIPTFPAEVASVAEELYRTAAFIIAEREIPKLAGGASDIEARVGTVEWSAYELLDSDGEGDLGMARVIEEPDIGWMVVV